MSNVIPLRAPQAPAVRFIDRSEPGVVINLRPEFALIRFANAAKRHAEEAGRMIESQDEMFGELMR